MHVHFGERCSCGGDTAVHRGGRGDPAKGGSYRVRELQIICVICEKLASRTGINEEISVARLSSRHPSSPRPNSLSFHHQRTVLTFNNVEHEKVERLGRIRLQVARLARDGNIIIARRARGPFVVSFGKRAFNPVDWPPGHWPI